MQIDLREMDRADFQPLFQKHSRELFDESSQVFRLQESLSEEEGQKTSQLAKHTADHLVLRLGVFVDGEFAGWHMGFQESAYGFYMCSSAILPQFRRKGLYAKLLEHVVDWAVEKGFQDIYSRHSPPNNAVIIPKLKFGFVISGMEVYDMFGTVVRLTYFPNPLRRKVFSYRTGHIKPDEEINRVFAFGDGE